MRIATAAASFALALLTACGSGGGTNGDSAIPPPATAYPVQSALAYAFTHGMQSSFSLNGTASNGSVTYPLTGSMTFTQSAANATSFEGSAAKQAVQTLSGTITGNGQTMTYGSTATLYLNAQYAQVGSSEPGLYCVALGAPTVPEFATAGQTGVLATESCYSDSSKRSLESTNAISWVTTPGAGSNTLNFEIVTATYDTLKRLIGSQSWTYAISATGVPTLIRIAVTASSAGVTVSFEGH